MYTIHNAYKLLQRYDGEFCTDETDEIDVECSFSAETVAGLVKKLIDFTNVDIRPDRVEFDVELDACEEPGRIDIMVFEDDEGMPLLDGEPNCWLVNYSFYVKACDTATVALTGLA